MKHDKLPLIFLSASLVLLTNQGASAKYETNYANVDVSRWRCLLCEFDTYFGSSGQFSMATVHTTDDSDRFGRNGSFERAGTRSVLDARIGVSRSNGWVVTGSASNIGLDSKDMSIVVKNRHSIDAQIRFQQYRRLSESEALSPFRRTNGRLTLGPDWHRDGQTHGFSILETANRLLELVTTRRLLESNVSVQLIPRTKLSLAHRSMSKEGTQGTFRDGLLQSTALPKAVDQESVTNRIQIEYRDERLNTAWSRSRSTLENFEPLLQWESPYRFGVLENVSSNAFSHEHFSDTFDLKLSLPRNSMLRVHDRQGETVTEPQSLRYGLSPLIQDVEPVLLFAKRDYRNRRLVLTTELLRDLELSVSRMNHEVKDRRPMDELTPALGGLFLLPSRALRLGDFDRHETELELNYRPDAGMYVLSRIWETSFTRANQEISENETRGLEVKISRPFLDRWEPYATHRSELRGASEFQDITANNPITRRFHQAEMKRRVWSGGVTYSSPLKSDFISLEVDFDRQDYPDSALGLSAVAVRSLRLGYGLQLGERIAANGYFASHRQISETNGSPSLDLSMPWTYASDDEVNSVGLRLLIEPFNGFVDNIEVVYTLSDGQAILETLSEERTMFFPNQVSRHESVSVAAEIVEIHGLTIDARIYTVVYDASDWSTDDVTQATLSSILTMSRDNPPFRNTLFSVSFGKSF